MHVPEELQRRITALPPNPGVYLMKDSAGRIIYIGKASNLKKRVSSYFQKRDHDPKTAVLVKAVSDLECIVTDTEIEALILESTMIKKHSPRYNIRLKDDKRYPFIAVTLHEDYPRVVLTRRILDNGSRYFGPYTDARAARNTVGMINGIFKLKRCTRVLPLRKGERPCINCQIGRCSGPCAGAVDREDYRAIIENVMEFLQGHIDPVIDNLTAMMRSFSDRLLYERASQVRDMIADIRKVAVEQKVSAPIGTDNDYIGASLYGQEALVVLFEFRKGVLLSRKIQVYDNARYSTVPDVIRAHILSHYMNAEVPMNVITIEEIGDRDLLQEYLSGKAMRRVTVRRAVSADDRGIMNLIMRNIAVIAAERKQGQERLRIEEGLEELRRALGLERAPSRMECVDISNLSGTDSVASLVSFRDGVPEKSSYRRYRMRGYEGANDPGMIHEVISRRLQHLSNEGLEPPDLIVVDGGPTQLARAFEARANFDLPVPIVALAKRFEEIYLSPEGPPLQLGGDSPARAIITAIRDEAHRFAVKYHRTLRAKRVTGSELDGLAIGDSKKKALLAHFKSIEGIRKASVEELMQVKGIGRTLAEKICAHYGRD